MSSGGDAKLFARVSVLLQSCVDFTRPAVASLDALWTVVDSEDIVALLYIHNDIDPNCSEQRVGIY